MAIPGKISGKRVYTGKVVHLDIDEVMFPDGSTGTLEMFRHPGASAIVPFISEPAGDDPQILLLRQYRYASGGYLLEIPAGRLDPGEEPLACAKRELREETGCTAQDVRLLTTFFPTPGFCDEKIHLFIASGLSQGATAHEKDEFMTVEKFPISLALAMIQAGEIRDGKTILGILFAAGFIAGR
jgi:ADP-ribose pyrophosphatase